MGNVLCDEHQRYVNYTKIMLESLLEDPDIVSRLRQDPKYEYALYVIAHRKAFKELESQTRYKGVFSPKHDIEKIGLTVVFGKEVTKILHKKLAPHHNEDWANPDRSVLVEKVFDWESSHYTKVEAPMTAYEFMCHAYPEHRGLLEPILKELGFWGHRNQTPLTEEQYESVIDSISDECLLAELQASYEYISTKLYKESL